MAAPSAPQAPASDAQASAPTAGNTQPPESASLDLDTMMAQLDRVLADPDASRKLLSHRALAGHIGGLASAQSQQLLAQERDKAEKKAEEKQLKKMMEEARDNPSAFADKWLKGIEADRSKKEVETMRSTVEEEFGKRLGAAITSVPEFQQLTPEEVGWLTQQMAGRPRDEVLGVFATAALDKLAQKRAERLHQEWKAKDLDTEVKARLKEQNAKRVAADKTVTVGRSASSGRTNDEPKFGTPDWDAWYERTVLGRRS